MRPLLGQRIDNFTQCGQGPIYLLGFLQRLTNTATLANLLAASQVHQS
jgi:hypothetical protein